MYCHLSGMHLSAEWKDEKKKKYYDKYVSMLTIHVHFSAKFVLLYHIGDFINTERRVNNIIYLSHFFTLSGTKFCIFVFQEHICHQITWGTKMTIYPIIYYLNLFPFSLSCLSFFYLYIYIYNIQNTNDFLTF